MGRLVAVNIAEPGKVIQLVPKPAASELACICKLQPR